MATANFFFSNSAGRRYHIGESLLPSVREYLQFIDAEELVATLLLVAVEDASVMRP